MNGGRRRTVPGLPRVRQRSRHPLAPENSDGANVQPPRINALNVEKANTRVAERRAKTAEAEARANGILAASVTDDAQRADQQVPGRRAGGAHQPAGLLAEHHGRANCAGPVTFGVFRYAWSDLCGTILVCALCGPLVVR
jgi:hypothetical protein